MAVRNSKALNALVLEAAKKTPAKGAAAKEDAAAATNLTSSKKRTRTQTVHFSPDATPSYERTQSSPRKIHPGKPRPANAHPEETEPCSNVDTEPPTTPDKHDGAKETDSPATPPTVVSEVEADFDIVMIPA